MDQLRKHIRNKRMVGLRQLGTDRVVVFTFGGGATQFHLLVEFYDQVRQAPYGKLIALTPSQGNIILTDANYTILSLLRPREDDSVVRLPTRAQCVCVNHTSHRHIACVRRSRWRTTVSTFRLMMRALRLCSWVLSLRNQSLVPCYRALVR